MRARNKRTEVVQTFRYFTGVAMAYFAALSLFTALQTGQIVNPSQIQSYVNLAINGVLFVYLSWSWLERKLGRLYLPVGLIAATVVPLFSNLVYLASPQETAQITIVRSWLLFPILIVPLVIIAWQYHFRYVLAFILLTSISELVILFSRLDTINFETLPILGLPLIRAFAFGMIGHIVTRLITTQRQQESQLLSANIKLSEHAVTLEQLTISRERNRLARELHDTLAHTLSGLTVNLEAIKILLGDGHAEIVERLDLALEKARTGLTDTRRALKDLRVKQVEDLGLKIALENLCLQTSSRGEFDLQLKLPEVLPDSSIQIEQAYYRIAQESLENIVKHARAKHVSLSIFLEDGCYCMHIEDDGIGFEPDQQTSPDSLGIRGMKERAAECGCQLEIEGQPGKGTQIKLITELNHV
ncbi:MAG TPA: sensor histidine kinase [Chloroflexi bacterium]|nr:sensor histidine kinase [Chloroflexota bacterium]